MPKNNKYTCLIIDDEPLAIEVIQEHLENFSEQIECIGTFTKPIESLQVLNTENVDILFLDINMPAINGIEFIKALPNKPYVIFTTAYREFAVDAFELNALDYLVKPVSTARFLKSINRFLLMQSENAQDKKANEFILIKADKKTYKIPSDSISYIESLDNYIKINTSSKSLICYDSLSSIENDLPAEAFLRIHRSYIINVNRIDHYTSSYVRIDDQQLTIGRNYKEQVRNALEN